jgi:cobalt transporter subunit CbtB
MASSAKMAPEARIDMQQIQSTDVTGVAAGANVAVQAFMAMALGLFIVGVVGFSHISAVHNAAHDVRHSNAFPCH